MATPVFDWSLFSPNFVIHFETLGAGRSVKLKDIIKAKEKFWEILGMFVVTGYLLNNYNCT